MPSENHLAYCGLYCGLCASRNRVPKQAHALWDTLKKEGYEHWGAEIYPNFKEFWQVLTRFKTEDYTCPSCKKGGGPPFCGIRKCAKNRNFQTCPLCDEFPCEMVRQLAKGYVTLIPDGLRLKEIGLKAWLAEQEDRAKTGFCYADVRCEPYRVPGDNQ